MAKSFVNVDLILGHSCEGREQLHTSTKTSSVTVLVTWVSFWWSPVFVWCLACFFICACVCVYGVVYVYVYIYVVYCITCVYVVCVCMYMCCRCVVDAKGGCQLSSIYPLSYSFETALSLNLELLRPSNASVSAPTTEVCKLACPCLHFHVGAVLTQVLMLDGKCSYPLSYLSTPILWTFNY